MEFGDIKLNYTPLKPELLMRHHEETYPEEMYYKSKIKQTIAIVGFMVIVLSILGIAYLYRKSIQKAIVASKKMIPTKAPPTPTIPRTKKKLIVTNFSSAAKGYSFEYPDIWTVEERNGFLESTHIFPPGNEFEIIISEGQIPYTFGAKKTTSVKKQLQVGAKTYDIEEVSVAGSQKLIDVTLSHPSRDLHVLIRTLTGDAALNASNIAAYEKDKTEIMAVISSIQYIDTLQNTAPTGWQEFNEFGFRLYHPTTFEITKKSDGEIVWGNVQMMLRSSSTAYKKLSAGSAFLVDRNTNRNVTADATITMKEVTMGDIVGQQYSFSCGNTCGYSVLYFSSQDTFYELSFDTAKLENSRQFDEIIAAIKFQ